MNFKQLYALFAANPKLKENVDYYLDLIWNRQLQAAKLFLEQHPEVTQPARDYYREVVSTMSV